MNLCYCTVLLYTSPWSNLDMGFMMHLFRLIMLRATRPRSQLRKNGRQTLIHLTKVSVTVLNVTKSHIKILSLLFSNSTPKIYQNIIL